MADHNATVSQTLSAVSQASTGETDFFTAIGSFTAENVVGFSFTQEYTGEFIATEVLVGGFTFTETHTFTATNAVEYYSEIAVHHSFTGTDSQQFEWTHEVTPSGALLKDEVEYSVTLPLTGTFTATDSQALSVTVSVTEVFYAQGTATPAGEHNVAVHDVAQFTNSIQTGLAETATSVFTATNSATHITEATEVTEHTFVGTDSNSAFKETFEELLDVFTGTEAITFDGSVYNNTIHDTGYIKDQVWAKDFGALAWVLNPETGGVYNYDNFGFNSLAVYNGVMYATSPEGVFALDADTDDGRDIDAEIELGFLDFKTDSTKRISDVYTGYTGGPLQCDVETYDGPQEVYTYDMEERDADAPRNNRIKVGRGLSSRYWRFTFRNVDGAEFQIYDISAVVGTSNRRL